jgi:hypothetical protein
LPRDLADRVGQSLDFAVYVFAQQLEGTNDGESYESSRYGVLGKFQTGFIAQEFLNHFRFAPLVVVVLGSGPFPEFRKGQMEKFNSPD